MGHYAAEMQLNTRPEDVEHTEQKHGWFYVDKKGTLHKIQDLSMYDRYMLRDEFCPSPLEAYILCLAKLEAHIKLLEKQRSDVAKKIEKLRKIPHNLKKSSSSKVG